MRAIVTGATGFIGQVLCRELLQSGYEVVAVIRPDLGSSAFRRSIFFRWQSLIPNMPCS